MLPTKGYFQDIECPYYNSSCGRPYCHFRHRKKLTENVEEPASESEREESSVIPTYKPTPKSELAIIHNKSHIPISYVPDLTFRPERKSRPLAKIEKPTYNPTPLSILSSVNKRLSSIESENGEHLEAIKEIKQNIASAEYDPNDPKVSLQATTDINFEDLSTEFDLIDEIINSKDKVLKNTTEEYSHVLDCKDPPTTTGNINQNKIKWERSDQDLKEAEKVKTSTEKNFKKRDGSKNEEINEGRDKRNKNEDVSNKITKPEEHCHNQKSDREKLSKIKTTSESPTKGANSLDNKKIKHKKSAEKSDCKTSAKKTKCKKSTEKTDSKKSAEKTDGKKSAEKTDGKSSSHSIKCLSDKGKSSSESKHSKTDHKSVSKDKKKDKEEVVKSNKSSSSRDKHRKEEHKDREKKDSEHKHRKEEVKEEHKDREKKVGEHKHRKEEVKDRQDKDRHRKKKDSATNHKEKPKYTDEKKDSSKKKTKSSSRDKNRDRKKSQSRDRSPNRNQQSKIKNEVHGRSRSSSRARSEERQQIKIKKCKVEKYEPKRLHKNLHRSDENRRSLFEIKTEICKSDTDSDFEDPTERFSNSMDFEDLSGLDLENPDQTLLECYKIFNEYNHQENTGMTYSHRTSSDENLTTGPKEAASEPKGKKRIAHANVEKSMTYSQLHATEKPKSVSNPGQVFANRYKVAKLTQATREQELTTNETQQSVVVKRSAPSLLEAARARKIKKLEPAETSTSLVDDIIKGKAILPKVVKIAPAQNVLLMAKAKERISLMKTTKPVKTIAQTQKGTRTAHVPDLSLADIPDVLQADKSKLPVNVRTRFLTMIADECVKLYVSKEEAFTRALNEEFSCYEKCKVLTTYRNSAMLAVSRLRKEVQERMSSGLGLIEVGEHSSNDPSGNFKGRSFYEKVKRWILTEEELDIHGYPRESERHGQVAIKNSRSQLPSNLDENRRYCVRCHRIYQVDDDGWPLFDEECLYHPLKKRTIRGEQTYLCCRSSDETGCATSDTHVSEAFSSADLEGFQTTMDPESETDPRSYTVYALDCEMCYTTKGLELTRVTIVDSDCKTVYESLVKPLNPIIDYNTRFSGITKEQMDRTSTSILQIQANILHLCNSQTILVGHSLESDMKALKIVHGTVVDTSVLFPHKMGLPHKRALRVLASEHLRKIIQNDLSGHDSAEDAVTCMELLKWKLKQELK